MKREEGFYWVLDGGMWIAAELQIENGKECWFLTGYEQVFAAEAFEEIGERIIKK